MRLHKTRVLVFIPGILMMFSLLLGGCAKDFEQTQGQIPQGTTQALESQMDWICIETGYGNMYYPQKWEDSLIVTQKVDSGKLTVQFDARLSEKQYTLFSVIVGEANGDLVGELTDDHGNRRRVYLVVAELADISNLSQGEQEILFAMQEDLNYLLDNLK